MVLFIPAASECLKGVWEVSGGCLSDSESGYSLEGGGGQIPIVNSTRDTFQAEQGKGFDRNSCKFITLYSAGNLHLHLLV